jgi:peptidoglycan/LPS O-acetylase OafA/YrhL
MRTLIEHPIALIVIGGLFGIALAIYARRSQRARAFLRYAVPVGLAIWAVADFIATPADRWVNGIALAVAALVLVVALGYGRFRGRSKAAAKQ